jgi:transposase
MYKARPELRQEVVHYYLKNKDSLKKTASRFNVHYQTVYKWVKKYREKGETSLAANYMKPWNRMGKDIEKKLVLQKENTPSITLKKAQEVLRQEGIRISLHGIWSVWKRYGYAGYEKENISNDFTEYGSWSLEAKYKFEQAQRLFDLNEINRSAEILNSIPFLPKNELLVKIPDNLLNLRRRVEKAYNLFGKLPLSHYIEMLTNLYEECKARNFKYLTLRSAIPEIATLAWLGRTSGQVKRIKELKRILNQTADNTKVRKTSLLFALAFTLLIAEGHVSIDTLNIRRAYDIVRTCRRLLKRQKYMSPHFMIDLGSLFLGLLEPKKGEYWYLRAIEKLDGRKKKRVQSYLAYQVYFPMGEYRKARRLLEDAELYDWVRGSWPLRFRAMYFLIKGMPQKAASLATESLAISKKDELPRDIFNANLVIAATYCSVGEKGKAENILNQLYDYFIKCRLRRQIARLEPYLDKMSEPYTGSMLPTVRLGWLVRKHKYRQAFFYARRKGLTNFFYHYLLFFPEVVLQRMEKGASLQIPKTMLRLPVFNRKAFVYHIKFLGNLVAYRNQKYLKINLRPKEKALLIHLALKLERPGKKILLEDLYRNFWPRSRKPSTNLSHIIMRIKQICKIPTHLLEVRFMWNKYVLINNGIFFTTDFQEFGQGLVRARAFQDTGEWTFARREYLRAFSLFRGGFFKKMYDPWSEEMRGVILNKLETEALNFYKTCLEYKNVSEGKKVLGKVIKIIPASENLRDSLS